jgi:hypothetical protein
MLTAKRADKLITRLHRIQLRKLSHKLLQEAYLLLLDGYSESFVSNTFGIDPNLMKGSLRSALEEALWERGYFSGMFQLR